MNGMHTRWRIYYGITIEYDAINGRPLLNVRHIRTPFPNEAFLQLSNFAAYWLG